MTGRLVAYACPAHGTVVRAIEGVQAWCRCGRRAVPVEQQALTLKRKETAAAARRKRQRGRGG